MTMLLCAEQITGTPDFQITHGDFKAGTKFSKFLDCL